MAKQSRLPGDDFETITELDKLIEDLNTHRTARLYHLEEERKLAQSLIAAMHRHNLTTYGDEDLGTFAQLIAGDEKVKVRTKKQEVVGEDNDNSR